MSRRALIFILLIAAAVLYAGSYIYVRNEHYLVHRAGFAYGMTDNHRVTTGDLGLGYHSAQQFAAKCNIFFTPLRWAETGFWYLYYPVGEPWPY